MTPFQKLIKYLAIGFGFFLIASMIAAVAGIAGLFTGIQLWKDRPEAAPIASETFPRDILALEMEIGAADIQILKGDEFRIQTDNPHITAKQQQSTLVIQEKSHIDDLDSSTLTITIPEDMVLEDVEISTGAGRLEIEDLRCREIDLELGAGMVEIQHLLAEKTADIDGGAGQIIIHQGSFRNLDFDMGVGKAEIFAALSGHCEISAGIGNLVLTIPSSPEDYTVYAQSGIGRIEVDGMHIIGSDTLGSGENRLNLEGGIGNIDVYFEP